MGRGLSLSIRFVDSLTSFSLMRWMNVTLFLMILIISGCTKVSSGSLGTAVNGGAASDTTTTTSDGSFHLRMVLPTAGSGSTYDMIGQNQEFDTYCNGGYGTCVCQYTYTQTGVGAQTTTGCVTYSESDLLRCVNSVPSGINSFSAQIIVQSGSSCAVATATASPSASPGASATATPAASTTTAGSATYTSNSLTVNLTSGVFAGSSTFIDLTNPSSFNQVQKYQCRKNEFIADPMDGNTIDPFQSMDPHVVYAFNYYTTNVADSLLKFHNASTHQDWECTLTATQDRSLQWWANPFVYSQTACTDAFCIGDGQQMAPQADLASGKIPVTGTVPSNGKRRSSFWVASKSYGVFETPIQAAVAPSSYVASTYGIIGYGARPLPNVNGSSSCPNITLPPNAVWVKLWNFRATDITAPVKVTSSSSIAAGGIACNSYRFADTNVNLFPSCSTSVWNDSTAAGSTHPSTNALYAFGNDATLGSPAVSSDGNGLNIGSVPMGLRISMLGAGNNSNACYQIDTNSWGGGGEKWYASPYNGWGATPTQIAGLPWNIYQQETAATTISSCQNNATGMDKIQRFITGAPGACPSAAVPPAAATSYPWLAEETPMDAQSQLTTVPMNGGTNYTDQMFVITDPNVSDSAMNGSTPSEYTPVTYRSSSDCNGASNAGCTASPIHWLINDHEVSSDPNAPNIFPLCVLQFYD